MTARTTLVGAALVGTVSLVLSACGSSSSNSADNLVIGDYPNSSLTMPLTVARKYGFFKDEGLDVDIVNVTSGPDLVASLIGGSTQIAVEVPDNAMPAMDQGETIMALPPFGRLDMNIVVPESTGITKVDQLMGRKLGVVKRGANSEKFFRTIFEEAGLDPDAATYLAIGAPAVQAASLQKGAVVATAASTSTVTLIESQGVKLRNLVSTLGGTAGALGDFGLQTFWGTTAKFYKSNKDKVSKFCRAMTRATEWINDDANRDAGIKLLAEHMKIPEASATEIWDASHTSWSNEVSEDQWSNNADWVLGDAVKVPFSDHVVTDCG